MTEVNKKKAMANK